MVGKLLVPPWLPKNKTQFIGNMDVNRSLASYLPPNHWTADVSNPAGDFRRWERIFIWKVVKHILESSLCLIHLSIIVYIFVVPMFRQYVWTIWSTCSISSMKWTDQLLFLPGWISKAPWMTCRLANGENGQNMLPMFQPYPPIH